MTPLAPLLTNAAAAARLSRDLLRLFRQPRSLEDSFALVRTHLARREDHFLAWVHRHVYASPGSPYRPLLDLAGCQYGDLERAVRRDGLEGALRGLKASGVYLSYEEFKGRTPVVRGHHRMEIDNSAFDNPLVSTHIVSRSGGTTGGRVSMPVDLRFIEYLSVCKAVFVQAYGLRDVPTLLYYSGPPDPVWFRELVFEAKLRLRPSQRWYSPTPVPGPGSPPLASLGLLGFRALGLAGGHRFPAPGHLPFSRAATAARWLADTARRHGRALMRSHVSAALVVAAAAREAGLDLTGVVFHAGGEATTERRLAEITSTGARLVPIFGAEELGGPNGYGCARPQCADDIHLFTDVLALIAAPREFRGVTVDSLHFTSLHPLAPKLLLNVEFDDTAVVQDRACDCFMGSLGFTTHLSSIRSFGKLTTAAGNVLGIDVVRILEQVLPGRFGGSAVDYQFHEEEGPAGAFVLRLLVSPRVGEIDERAVRQAVLDEVRQGRPAYRLTADLWQQAEALVVERRDPVVSPRGKILPVHFARTSPGGMDGPSGRARP